MKQQKFRWMAWWYLAIAVAFALLAVAHIIARGKPWLIAIRLILAVGFGWLARMEFKKKGRL